MLKIFVRASFFIVATIPVMAVASDLPSPAAKKEVCDLIAAGSPDYEMSYPGSVLMLDINNDGVKEKTERISGGSMGVESFSFLNKNGEIIKPKPQGFEWKDYWAYGYKLLEHRGQVYHVHFKDHTDEYPLYVSYVNKHNNEYVFCEFETGTVENVLSGGEICRNLRGNNQQKYVSFNVPHNLTSDSVSRATTSVKSSQYIDFDNDGNKEWLVALGYHSGAGSGCDFDYFDLLNPAGDHIADGIKHELLMKLQDVQFTTKNRRHPGPTCIQNDAGWMLHDGKYYYESKYKGNEPRGSLHQFHSVRIIHNGQIKDICEYEFSTGSKVKP